MGNVLASSIRVQTIGVFFAIVVLPLAALLFSLDGGVPHFVPQGEAKDVTETSQLERSQLVQILL